MRGGGDSLDSILFGSRAERVEEIQNVIEVVMRDGTVQQMTALEARDAGVDPGAVRKTMLDDILANAAV